ncbi:MAG: hypothetical protein KF878_10125 [Planctomycetes bacterium]|nr:hypothetical protein [Planctomycetota bacterium]
MTDPLSLLRLDPGERVIWQGRAAVGTPGPVRPVLAILLVALLFVLGGIGAPGGEAAVVLGAVLGLPALVVALGRVVGPSHAELAWLLLAAPFAVAAWLEHVSRHGPRAALERAPSDLIAPALLVGIPLGLTVLDVLERLNTVYVVTDSRAAAVRVWPAAVVLWERRHGGPAGDLRLERGRRTRDDALVLGPRRLRLRDDDPATVLELVRREGGG